VGAKRHRLLIVEDDPGLQRQLKWALQDFEIRCAGTRREALAALAGHAPSLILQDLGLPPDENGVEEGFATIAEIHERDRKAKIVVLTGQRGREHAVRAIRLGAHDFCEKPVDAQLVATILDRAARLFDLESAIERAGPAEPPVALDGIIGASAAMRKVCSLIQKLAPTQLTVLLLGESGTGKERLARALHALSTRAQKSFVAINCAAIPESLLESELFGHERGAFTGAVGQKIGRIETANGGTLFLDEIGDMPAALQAKLLRFLQERLIERVGGHKAIPVDVRVIAATNQQLDAAVARGSFRLDLYYRVNEVAVTIPPLRERESDAIQLATHFLQRAERPSSPRATSFSAEAIAAIDAHPWPGNVRELENRVNRAIIMAEGPVITAEDLGLSAPAAAERAPASLREVRHRAELHAIHHALALTGGNISKAAEMLGVARQTLYELLSRSPKPE